MDQVHVIRHKIFVEGLSRREVAEQLGISRNTVKKYLAASEPQRVRNKAHPKPVLSQVAGRIDQLLAEWQSRTTAKQRITSPLILSQLHKEGYQVGETTVKDYLREKRRAAAEVFIPLIYQPGEVAQADFFEVTVDLKSERIRVWKFLLRMMNSGYDFAWLYQSCDQLSFLDAHVRAFVYFGAVPQRIVYDNLSAAVKRRIGCERELTDRFLALTSHYLFEPCFTRPGEGHDKGGVESRGKAIRLQHLTPIPHGESLSEISQSLLTSLQQAAQKPGESGISCYSRFQTEVAKMRPLPLLPFEARRTVVVSVSSKAMVHIDGATYSVPSHWARLDATAQVGVEDVRIICRGEVEVYQKEPRGSRRVRYRHYLRELSRKPQAVRQVASALLPELGEPYEQLWQLLVQTYGGREAGRVLARILGTIVEHGEEAVKVAIAQALGDQAAPIKLPLVHRSITIPESLRDYEIESGRASDYDWLLAGGQR